ncbi:MAG: glutamate racemase [Clostridiales bacterium]|nr:glutamate racemase [Clostridiales bacterium]
MDQRPIGVFDSGLGGLTALKELRQLLPGEELIYFGDTGRVPYGGRGRDTILRYARQDVAFLRTFDPKAIIIACGTVSANALAELTEENDLPVFGVVAPAAQAAASATRGGRIGLIGTAASIRSGAYEREIARLKPEARVFSQACPLFVPLVENGRFLPGDPVAELVAQDYLSPLREQNIDVLVLGCTHYPLLSPVIRAAMGPEVTLIDTGKACAKEAAEQLARRGLLAERARGGCRYFVSDSTEDFARLAGIFLGEPVAGGVERVEIEQY